MSGHSKWSSIRHKKAVVDARRGKLFTKLIKEITVAARIGGGDTSNNPRLRLAIQAAKAANMPSENIQRAVKKGTGELPGVSYEESTYEGYGPGGIAILVTTLSDNKNRTVSEIRHIFSKHGGSLGENGCVSWMFEKKGLIVINSGSVAEDKLIDVVLEAGAEDMKTMENTYEVITGIGDFEAVKNAVDKNGIQVEMAEISMIPQNTVKIEDDLAPKILKLMEKLEDNDDVQNVYSNFDISDEVMEQMES